MPADNAGSVIGGCCGVAAAGVSVFEFYLVKPGGMMGLFIAVFLLVCGGGLLLWQVVKIAELLGDGSWDEE